MWARGTLVSLLMVIPSFSGHSSSDRFDILGIKLGADSSAVLDIVRRHGGDPRAEKTSCLSDLLAKMPASGRRKEGCLGKITAGLDAVHDLRAEFVEDLPDRPGVMVVTRVELRYRYLSNSGPKRPADFEMRSRLVEKYGKPIEDIDNGSFMSWGSMRCTRRFGCPLRGAYVDYTRGMTGAAMVANPERLTLGSEEFAAPKRRAMNEALERARPEVKPKF